MKGPPPIPTVLKLLRGNPGKRAINHREPQPGALCSNVPRELWEDQAAAHEWRRTIAPAIKIGQITAGDRAMAIGYCSLWATWRSQLESAIKHPHVVSVGKSGHPLPNPARGMANTTYTLLMRTAAELGLTPASRSRVVVSGGQAAEANPLEKYLNKGRG